MKESREKFYKKLPRWVEVVVAVVLILYGVIALLTPFTPGSWLILIGLFMIFGREKTLNKIHQILGDKIFNKFKKALDKIPSKKY